jgi:hypothetical protein
MKDCRDEGWFQSPKTLLLLLLLLSLGVPAILLPSPWLTSAPLSFQLSQQIS